MAKKKQKPGAKDALSVPELLRGVELGASKKVKDDRKLRAKIRNQEKQAQFAAEKTAHFTKATLTENYGLLEGETPLERTFKVTQEQIRSQSDLSTQKRGKFQLDLSSTGLGPYGGIFSPSGNQLLVYGQKGHVSVTNWKQLKLTGEIYLNETIRHGIFLHDDGYMALAQKKYVYMYDSSGIELHTMRHHANPICLQFLPYHFLLTSLGETGIINYTDTSTGNIVSELKTSSLAKAGSMRVNNYNGTLAVGHSSGVVSLWSPISSEPLAKLLTHRGRLNSIAISADGNRMITAGSDARVNVWDLRTFQKISNMSLPVPASRVELSQKGLLAVSFGPHIKIWKESVWNESFGAPYMENLYEGKPVETMSFCPYEDILGVAHSKGFTNMIVPGAGEANFDSSLPNPFENRKQRREREVSSLMEKLGPETITLDPTFIGTVDKDPVERLREIRASQQEAQQKVRAKQLKKKRTRGRNKIGSRLKRKQQNVIDEKSERLRELQNERKAAKSEKAAEKIDPLLNRFRKRES